MRIVALEHVAFESPGSIAEWAKERGHSFEVIRFHAGDPLPGTSEVDLLVVMGGPMNIHEHGENPWLKDEKAFILSYLATSKPALGICLGAQLIAYLAGARVIRNPEPEIGWFPVEWTDTPKARQWFPSPEPLTTFHWHFDTFEMPKGAERLASSAGCPNQAFLLGSNILGLQFHPEMTPATVQSMVKHCGADLKQQRPYVQTAEAVLHTASFLEPNRRFLYAVLDRLTQN